MEYKIDIEDFYGTQADNALRFVRCWNILRTMTDEQLESLEKQVDLVIEEVGEDFVDVHIGLSLHF